MEIDHRPWGCYEILAAERDHKVKRIIVLPGQRLSSQRHRLRTEHWYVIRGAGIVTLNNEERDLKAGASVDIPRGAWHRMHNPGQSELVFIEIQAGEYFGEDDIERQADDYGRI